MGGYAWVTLATNNSYSLGALVLGHSLKKSNTAHKLVVLITSAVSESMRNQLGTVFDLVKLVDVLDSKDEAHLALMQRPELGVTFTKIHCWRLTEFEKCVFLDADTLVVRNCDELFEREEFSAAPDASWPDCFNSGVFVFRPSIDTFNKILQFAVENKSFDGGDQGLLNQFFSSWATEDIKKHLPFVYNLTSIGSYAYIPAFKHYGSETRIVHFIGTGKPWLQQLDVATKTVAPSAGYEHLAPLLQQWWDLFCEKVHPNLDKNLESSNEGMSHSHVEACSNSLPSALTDESQTLPCTPLKETVVTEHNFPHRTNDSSGESPKPQVFFVVPEIIPRIERVEERIEECKERVEKRCKERVKERNEEEKEEQEEPPPKDPFDFESFFPDETCIKSYLEQNVVTYQPFESKEEVKPLEESPPLPRFLSIPEDDRRQSGNIDEIEKHETEKQPSPQKESTEIERTKEKKVEEPPRETLTKSKSMPYLPLEVTPPEPPRSIWKSQPNVNIDPNKKYSMPKLKPIIPKQKHQSVRTKIPKITQYTEFLMSSEYKDPLNLPKDRIGFVATELHTQKHKRNKPNGRTKFGPLPFLPSPETEKPACKKIRLEHSDDDLYDLTLCKRQSGNKPKPKQVQKKPDGNNLEEILKRLKEFSKDYLHYFGVVPKPRRRIVICKDVIIQVGGQGECRSSEAFKIIRTEVCCWSRGTQTEEFLWFRNYIKDQNETSQKGLLMISGKANVAEETGSDEVTVGKIRHRRNTSITRSENQDSTKEKSLMNHHNDLRKTAQSNGLSFKSKKPENIPDGVVVKSPKAQNVTQSKNLSKLLPNETENGVIVQNNGVSLKQKKFSDYITSGPGVESKKVENTVEKPVVKSKSSLVKEETQRKNIDDVITSQDNGVLSKSEKVDLLPSKVSPSRISAPYSERDEKLPRHPENHFGMAVGEIQLKNPSEDVITHQMSKRETLEVHVPDSKGSEEPLLHPQNQSSSDDIANQKKDSSDDVTTTPIKDFAKEQKSKIKSPRVQSNRLETAELDAHFETQSKLEKPRENLTLTTKKSKWQISEFSTEDRVGTPRVQSPLNEKECVTLSGNELGSIGGEEKIIKDVETPQKAQLKLKKSPESGEKPPEVQSPNSTRQTEHVVPLESQSKLVTEENQQDDDVLKSQNNRVLLKLQQVSVDGVGVESTEVESRVFGSDVTVQNNGSLLEQKFMESNKDGIEKVESLKSKKEEESVVHLSSNDDVTNCFSLKQEANSTPKQSEQNTPDDVTSVQPLSAVVVEQNGQKSQKREKKPEEILCVPDFETPRSSRVTLKTTEKETTGEKQRKPRPTPKKVKERFRKDSPDESVRFSSTSSGIKHLEDASHVSGIAGAIAQLSLQAGSEQTPESSAASAAHQEYLRRQNWESGNIDYMGRDSFDNIWSKICQTLEAKEQDSQTTEKATVPEYIETLPGKPVSGPVEDDEIIFSKSDSKQSGFMNISEEKEVGGEGVKLSDILGGARVNAKPPSTQPVPSEMKAGLTEVKTQLPVVSGDGTLPLLPSLGAKPQALPTEVKVQPTAIEIKPESEIKSQPVGVEMKSDATTVKAQFPAASADIKPQSIVAEEKAQPIAAETKPQAATNEAKPGSPVVKSDAAGIEVKPPTVADTKLICGGGEAKVQPAATGIKPESTVAEVKSQPQPTPAEIKPGPLTAEVKPQSTITETKPQSSPLETKTESAAAVGIPQPTTAGAKPQTALVEVKPVSSATDVKPELTAKGEKPQLPPKETKLASVDAKVKPQPAATEAMPQLKPEEIKPSGGEVKPEPPREGNTAAAEAKPQPSTTDIKPGVGAAEMKPQPAAESKLPPTEPTAKPTASPSDQKQPPTPSTPTGECKVVAIPSPPILPSSTHPKTKQPLSERPQVQSEPIPLPPPDSPSSEQSSKTSASDSSKDDGKQKKGVFTKILEMVGVKEKNGNDGGKSVFYDVEGSGEKKEPETVQPKDSQSIQVTETKRKSPSPKLTMPPTPETAVTTPTPPPTEELPKRKNSALLKVDETILETPPVPEPSTIQTEIEDIIGKAKTEVETLIQEKDIVNTMKLIMGEEQEEVEELKVTSEEERKRHKGEVVTSKLSDQILKAIPPPRRKAISDANASTSAIPKASNSEQQKSPQAGEGKSKSAKPSSIPVPPPRNKGKPQPPPSKGKGKK